MAENLVVLPSVKKPSCLPQSDASDLTNWQPQCSYRLVVLLQAPKRSESALVRVYVVVLCAESLLRDQELVRLRFRGVASCIHGQRTSLSALDDANSLRECETVSENVVT